MAKKIVLLCCFVIVIPCFVFADENFEKAGLELQLRHNKVLQDKICEIESYVDDILCDYTITCPEIKWLGDKLADYEELLDRANNELEPYNLSINEDEKMTSYIRAVNYYCGANFRDDYNKSVEQIFTTRAGNDVVVLGLAWAWRSWLTILLFFLLIFGSCLFSEHKASMVLSLAGLCLVVISAAWIAVMLIYYILYLPRFV